MELVKSENKSIGGYIRASFVPNRLTTTNERDIKGREWTGRSIVFESIQAVNLLQDFLIHNKIKSFMNKKIDVCNRFIIADGPFRLCSIDYFETNGPSRVTVVSDRNQNDSNSTTTEKKMFQCEITGPITGEKLKELIDIQLSKCSEYECVLIPVISFKTSSIVIKFIKHSDGTYEVFSK